MPLTGLLGTDSSNEYMMTRIGGEEAIFVNATSTNAAATANGAFGIITTESLTSPAAVVYSLVLTNSFIGAGDIVQAQVGNGTNTQGTPTVAYVTPAAGSATIVINNTHTATAYSGTLKISYTVIKAATTPIPVLSS